MIPLPLLPRRRPESSLRRRSRGMSCSSGESRPTEGRAQGRGGEKGATASEAASEKAKGERILMGAAGRGARSAASSRRSVGWPIWWWVQGAGAAGGKESQAAACQGGNEGQKLRSSGVLQLEPFIEKRMLQIKYFPTEM